MSKRAAPDYGIEASPSKRLHIDAIGSSYSHEDDDIYTPSSSPQAEVNTPATAATTPRTKFPSEYKTLACTWPGCPKAFNRPARLRDHLNSHTNSRPHKCPYDGCDKDYIEDKHLKQHIKATHTNERKYVCQREGCGKTFVTGTRLKRHQAVHEGADRFRCQDCGQSFRKKETLNKHVRKDHQGLSEFACPGPGCVSAFHTRAALSRHREREHGELKFWCHECAAVALPNGEVQRVGFTTDFLLKGHMKQEHRNCLFCEYKPQSAWELTTHIEMHHSGKTVEDRKQISCTHKGCTKKFTKRSNLNMHIRTAHEGFRFICGEFEVSGPLFEGWSNDQGCGDKFSTKVRLEDHIRFIHLLQERPKQSKPDRLKPVDIINDIAGVPSEKRTIFCTKCDEAFTRYYDLNKHIAKYHDPEAQPPTTIPEAAPSSLVTQETEAWPTDPQALLEEAELFTAEVDYELPQSDWLEDEANIMLLAGGGGTSLDLNIDPALMTM